MSYDISKQHYCLNCTTCFFFWVGGWVGGWGGTGNIGTVTR